VMKKMTNSSGSNGSGNCLLRVTVLGENLVNGKRTVSRIWLVDLAGSERAGKTGADAMRLKEASCINLSLSTLGEVIFALATKKSYIPYRRSKLTRVLQSSLGGDCKTLMFVQISPSLADLGETLSSLRFARRARGVELGPARKETGGKQRVENG
nr:kinesin-like protein KIN-14S [Tanacetum cinerariifolium]